MSFHSLVVNITINIESVTQAGSRVTLNDPSGSRLLAQSCGSFTITIPPDHEQAIGVEGSSGELQLYQQSPPTERRMWDVILSAKERTLSLLFYYFGYVRKVFVRSHDVGSLLITVECSSLQILEELWEDYRNGHLTEIAQEILVTAEVLEKLGLDEVRLETFISEEEYEKGKQIFMDSSGECVILTFL